MGLRPGPFSSSASRIVAPVVGAGAILQAGGNPGRAIRGVYGGVTHPLSPCSSSQRWGGIAADRCLDLEGERGCWLGRDQFWEPWRGHSHFFSSVVLTSVSPPQTILPPFESSTCVCANVCVRMCVSARALPLPWHQCDMALNGLCHVKQAPSVNYLAKALAFLEQFIPAWAGTAPACVCLWITVCMWVRACAFECKCECMSSPLLL